VSFVAESARIVNHGALVIAAGEYDRQPTFSLPPPSPVMCFLLGAGGNTMASRWRSVHGLVFVDPDNGLELNGFSHGSGKRGNSILLSELPVLARTGRCLRGD
jgi:hypothetical protein